MLGLQRSAGGWLAVAAVGPAADPGGSPAVLLVGIALWMVCGEDPLGLANALGGWGLAGCCL